MEKFNNYHNNNSSRIWSGVIIIAVGLVFFLGNMGIHVPSWVFSWHMLLIVIGLLIGYKRDFTGGGWLIMVIIGGYFTVSRMADLDLSKYYFALAFIVVGLFLIFKPQRKNIRGDKWKKRYAHFDFADEHRRERWGDKRWGNKQETAEGEPVVIEEQDILEATSFCGSCNQNVFSKNFKGGEVVAIFGGCDINLTQADFQGTVVMDVVAMFGGIKLVVPANWEVRSEVTAIFGGMDDKRAAVMPADEGMRKILIIKGVALFGGVEIKNF